MKYTYSILLVVSLVLLLVPVPATAQGSAPYLPPLPDWPVLGPILRLIGIGPDEALPTPESMLPPDPGVPTYRFTGFDEAWSLWQSLESGQRVRMEIAEDDVNQALQDEIAAWPEILEASVTFDEGELTVATTIDRGVLEIAEVDFPFLPRGETLTGQAEFRLGAESCRLTVDVVRARLNDRTLWVRYPLGRAVNAALDEYWPDTGCLKRIIVTSDTLTIEGYK